MFNKTNTGSSTPETTKKPTPSSPRSVPSSSVAAPSILASDIIITGDIKTNGDVQIDGRLDGNIKANNVTIGEQGIVNGKVSASNVHVRGKLTGKVDATSVELSETANVQADLIQDQLMIANGAFFDGKCARKSGAPTPAPKPKAKAK